MTVHFANSFYEKGLGHPLPMISGGTYLLTTSFSRAIAWRRLCASQKKIIQEPFQNQTEETAWFRRYANSDLRSRNSLRNELFRKCEFLIEAVLKFSKCLPQEREDKAQSARVALIEAIDIFASHPEGRFIDFAFEFLLSSLKPSKEEGKYVRAVSRQIPLRDEDHRTNSQEILITGEALANIRREYDEALEKAHDPSGNIPLSLERAVHEFLRQRGELDSLADIAAAHGIPLQLVVDAVWKVVSSNQTFVEMGKTVPQRKEPGSLGRQGGLPRRTSSTRPSLELLSLKEVLIPSELFDVQSLQQRVLMLEAAITHGEPASPLHQKLKLILSEASMRLLQDWEEWLLENKSEKIDPEWRAPIQNFLPTYALFAVAHYGREVPLSITYLEWVFVCAREHFKTKNPSLSEETWRQVRHFCIHFLSTQSIRRGQGYRDEAVPKDLFSAEHVKAVLGEKTYAQFRDAVFHALGRRRLPPYERSFLFRRILDLLWSYGDALLRHQVPVKGEIPFHSISYQEALRKDFGGPYSVAVQEIFLEILEVDIRRQGLDPAALIWEEGREARTLEWAPLTTPFLPVLGPRFDLQSAPEEWASYLIRALGMSNGAGAIRWLNQHPLGILAHTIVYFWGKNVPADWRFLNSLIVYLQAEKAAQVRGDNSVPQHLHPMEPFDAFQKVFGEECPFRVTRRDEQDVIVISVPRMMADTSLTLDQVSLLQLVNRYLDDEKGSYKDLAKVWNVSEQTVRLYSKGYVQKMRMDTLRELASALASSEEQKERLVTFLLFLRFRGFFEANFNIIDEQGQRLQVSPPFASRYPVVLEWDTEPLKPLVKTTNIEFQKEPIASVLAGLWDEIFIFVENFADGFLVAGDGDIRIPQEFKKFINTYLPHEDEIESLSPQDLHDLVLRLRSEYLLYSLSLRSWFEGEEVVSTDDKKKIVQFYRMMHLRISDLITSRQPQGHFQSASKNIAYTIVSPSREFSHGARVQAGGDVHVVAADIISWKNEKGLSLSNDIQRYLVQLRILKAFSERPDLPASLQSWGCSPEQTLKVLAIDRHLEGRSQDWSVISDFLREPAERKLKRILSREGGFRLPPNRIQPDREDVVPSMTLERIADQVFGDYLRAWWLQAGVRFVASLDWNESLVLEKLERRLSAHPELTASREKILKLVQALISGFNARSPHQTREAAATPTAVPAIVDALPSPWHPKYFTPASFKKEEAGMHWSVIEEFSKNVPEDIRPFFLRHIQSLVLSAQPLSLQDVIDDVIGPASDRHQREVRGFLAAQAYDAFWKNLRARASLLAEVMTVQERELRAGKKFQGRAGFCDDVVLALMERAPQDPLYESVTSSRDFVKSEVQIFDVLGRVTGGFPQLAEKMASLFQTLDEREVQEKLREERADEARRRGEVKARLAELENRRIQAEIARQAERARRDAEIKASDEARRIAAEETYRKAHLSITRAITRERFSLPLEGAVSQDLLASFPELVVVDPESITDSVFSVLGDWFDLSRPDETVEKIVSDFTRENARDLVQVLSFLHTLQARSFKDPSLKDDLAVLLFEIGEWITVQKNTDVLPWVLEGYRNLRDRVHAEMTVLERISFFPEFLAAGRPLQNPKDIFDRMIDFMSRRILPDELEEAFDLSLTGRENVAEFYLKHQKRISRLSEIQVPDWMSANMDAGMPMPEELARLVDNDYPELYSVKDEEMPKPVDDFLRDAIRPYGFYLSYKIVQFVSSFKEAFPHKNDLSPRGRRLFTETDRFLKNIKILEVQVKEMEKLGWESAHLIYGAHQIILKMYHAFRPHIMKLAAEEPGMMEHLVKSLPEVQALPSDRDLAVYEGLPKVPENFIENVIIVSRIANAFLSRPATDSVGGYIREKLRKAVHVYRMEQSSFSVLYDFSTEVLRYYWRERKTVRAVLFSPPEPVAPQEDLLQRFPELAHISSEEVALVREELFTEARKKLSPAAVAYQEAVRTDFADRLNCLMSNFTESEIKTGRAKLYPLHISVFLSLLGIHRDHARALQDQWLLEKYMSTRDRIDFGTIVRNLPEVAPLYGTFPTGDEASLIHREEHFSAKNIYLVTVVQRLILRSSDEGLRSEFDQFKAACPRQEVMGKVIINLSSREVSLWYLSHRDRILSSVKDQLPKN